MRVVETVRPLGRRGPTSRRIRRRRFDWGIGWVGEVGFPTEAVSGLKAEGGGGAGAGVLMEDKRSPSNDPGAVPLDGRQAGGAKSSSPHLQPVEVLSAGDPDLFQGQDLELGRVGDSEDKHKESIVVHHVGRLGRLEAEPIRFNGGGVQIDMKGLGIVLDRCRGRVGRLELPANRSVELPANLVEQIAVGLPKVDAKRDGDSLGSGELGWRLEELEEADHLGSRGVGTRKGRRGRKHGSGSQRAIQAVPGGYPSMEMPPNHVKQPELQPGRWRGGQAGNTSHAVPFKHRVGIYHMQAQSGHQHATRRRRKKLADVRDHVRENDRILESGPNVFRTLLCPVGQRVGEAELQFRIRDLKKGVKLQDGHQDALILRNSSLEAYQLQPMPEFARRPPSLLKSA